MKPDRWVLSDDHPLAQRIQLAAFGITMLVIVIFGGASVTLALTELPAAQRAAHAASANVIGEVLGGDLRNRLANFRQLAESPLVWTGLTDSTGREAYLRPLLASLGREADTRIALLDYRGRPLIGDLRGWQIDVDLMERTINEVLGDGRPRQLVMPGSPARLFVARAVTFPYTGESIGVLAGVIDLSALFRARAASIGNDRSLDLVHGGRVVDTLSALAERHHPARYPIELAEPLADGELAVELYAIANPLQAPVVKRLILALLGAIVLAAVVWHVVGLVARRTTRRLDALVNVCAAVARNEPVSIPEDGHGDEIGVLTRTLRLAIEAYAEVNERMADLVNMRSRQLAESEERLRGSIDAIDEAFVIFDGNDKLLYSNQKYRDVYPSVAELIEPGTSFETIVRTWAERGHADVPDGDIDAWVAQRIAAHRNGSVLIQHTENDRWVRIVERKTGVGDIVGFRVDITELVKAKEAAEQANVAKSRFLATMSHEIRTPMNGILGMAQLLLQPGLSASDRDEYARTILNAGQALMMLLNDVLDLSKVEAGKLELSNAVFEPAAVIDDTVALFREAARQKGLRLDAAWEGPAGQCYLGDPHRLLQMLTNLVGNAVKFTDSGEIRIRGREAERESDCAIIEFHVSDTGIGIPAAQQALLFKPFSQIDSSTTRQHGGTGLGLSIVSSLARLMQGMVGVSSEEGKGACFWFRVRAELAGPGEQSVRHIAHLADQRTHRGMPTLRGNVLVVEDNATNRRVIGGILAKLGLDVAFADDGEQGAALATRAERPDIVLMDLHMPVLDGYEATRRIRAWERGQPDATPLPIVALTANAFEQDRELCMAAGMNDFITKPVSIDSLAAMLVRWLQPKVDPADAPSSPVAPRRPADAAVLMPLIDLIRPLLAQNKYDALGRFDELRSAAAGTDAEVDIAAVGEGVAHFRFELARLRLDEFVATRGWRSEAP